MSLKPYLVSFLYRDSEYDRWERPGSAAVKIREDDLDEVLDYLDLNAPLVDSPFSGRRAANAARAADLPRSADVRRRLAEWTGNDRVVQLLSVTPLRSPFSL